MSVRAISLSLMINALTSVARADGGSYWIDCESKAAAFAGFSISRYPDDVHSHFAGGAFGYARQKLPDGVTSCDGNGGACQYSLINLSAKDAIIEIKVAGAPRRTAKAENECGYKTFNYKQRLSRLTKATGKVDTADFTCTHVIDCE